MSRCAEGIGVNSVKNEVEKEKYKIKISKGFIVNDGYSLYPSISTSGLSSVEFVIGVNYNGTKWVLNRGLNQIQNLHKTFNKTFPNLRLDLHNLNFSSSPNTKNTKTRVLNEFHKNILDVEKFLNSIFKSKSCRDSQTFLNFIEYDQYYHVLDTEELGDKTSTHIKKLSECNLIDKEKFITEFNFSPNTLRGSDYINIDTDENLRYNIDESLRKDSNISKETNSGVNPFNSTNKKVINVKNYETVNIITNQDSKTDFKRPLNKNLMKNKKKSCSVDLNPKNDKDSYVSTAISKIKEFIYNLFFKTKRH